MEHHSEWKLISTQADRDSAKFVCEKCGNQSAMHPEYKKFGISGCIGQRRCNGIVVSARKMIIARGWEFIDVSGETKASMVVRFKTPGVETHVCQTKFLTLALGGGCKSCAYANNSSKATKVIGVKMPERTCSCKGHSCVHYNHLIVCPDSAKEWDYEANHPVRPEDVSPSSHKKFWWICSRAECCSKYEQTLHNRALNSTGCPYCSGKKVSETNCIAATHPHLVEQFDSNNEYGPYDITAGSAKIVNWICNAVPGENHRWSTMAVQRTSGMETGCPWCNRNGYAQEIGGHEYYIQQSRLVHGDKYIYTGIYEGSTTPIEIVCPIINKFGIPHGPFMQCPSAHKGGQGCPICASSKTVSNGQLMVERVLLTLGFVENTDWIREMPFDRALSDRRLRFDIAFKSLRFVIEYDGKQHFRNSINWEGRAPFSERIANDKIKDEYCIVNKISILRIPYIYDKSTDIRRILEIAFDYVKRGHHFYATYPVYRDYVAKMTDLSTVTYCEMKYPILKQENPEND